MSTRGRINGDGPAVEFVTTSAHNRQYLFRNDAIALNVLKQLSETAGYFTIAIMAYVLMPSHLHAILGLPKARDLSKFMQSFKSLSSRRIRHKFAYSINGFQFDSRTALWQPRFDDVLIISELQFNVKLDYIHNNPVKAGLVQRPEEWKYSSAGFWLKEIPGPIVVESSFKWMEIVSEK
ncbi:conserved hypothetical protein [Candidatus Zixiibacteriota bacterium]|nr:conserved hypothetical protein [candidate division Zixibacteria bacterium]